MHSFHLTSCQRLAAGLILLLGLLAACAPSLALERQDAETAPAEGADGSFQIIQTRLLHADERFLQTQDGQYLLSPEHERYIRHADQLRVLGDMTPYSGWPLTLHLVDGQVSWLVVESPEPLP